MNGIDVVVDAVHHAQRLVEATHQVGARIELLGEDVVHSPVRVVDDDLRCAGGRGALDGRVDVGGHEVPEALVLDLALHELVAARDPADAFAVGRDQDLHRRSP